MFTQQHVLSAWLVYIIISSGSLAGPASARRAIKQHYVEALHSFLHRPILRERHPAMPEHVHLQQQQMLDAMHQQKHQDLHTMMHKKQQAAAGAGAGGTASTAGGATSSSATAAGTTDSRSVHQTISNVTESDVVLAQHAKWQEGYVAICAVVKDQNRDLRYWIEYHRWLGVGKFYIMDNNSSMPAMMVLWDYIKSGLVDYQYFVGKPRTRPMFTDTNQYRAYQGCLLQHFKQHRWLAFIDIDEFFVLPHQRGQPLSAWQPPTGDSSAVLSLAATNVPRTAAENAAGVDAAAAQTQQQPPEQSPPAAAAVTQQDTAALPRPSGAAPADYSSSSLANSSSTSSFGGSRTRPSLALFLADYERYAALGVNWVMFGSGGWQQRPPAGPLASYSACVPQDHLENSHVKVVANTGGVLGLGMTPHEILPRPGRSIVDVDGVAFTGPKTPHAKWHKLVLHHYVLKSRDEFAGKHARGSGAGNIKGWEFFDHVDSISHGSCAWGQGVSKAFFASRPRLRPPTAGHPCTLRSKQISAAAAAAGHAAAGLQEAGDASSAAVKAQQQQQQQQQQQTSEASSADASSVGAAAAAAADDSADNGASTVFAELE